MRNTKPIKRVKTAKAVMTSTDFVKVRIHMNMFVKVKYEKGKLFEIACECGVAPCTVILANGCRNEDELPPEILVPVATALRCKIIDYPK